MADRVKWMYPEMQAFLRDRGGRWKWGYCDCVELLLHLVARATGIYGDRSRYIQTGTYGETIAWLSALADPMQPYLDFIRREAGLVAGEPSDWQIGVIHTRRPIRLNSEIVYPTDIAPGLIFHPPSMEPCILHRAGYSPVTLYEDDVIKFERFRLSQGL